MMGRSKLGAVPPLCPDLSEAPLDGPEKLVGSRRLCTALDVGASTPTPFKSRLAPGAAPVLPDVLEAPLGGPAKLAGSRRFGGAWHRGPASPSLLTAEFGSSARPDPEQGGLWPGEPSALGVPTPLLNS